MENIVNEFELLIEDLELELFGISVDDVKFIMDKDVEYFSLKLAV